MESLPQETLISIAEHCDHASAKNLRLVNGAFRHAASPSVFEHVYMALFEDSLIKMQNIAASDDPKTGLARHVKKLTFLCDVLPDFDDFQQYCGFVDRVPTYDERGEGSEKSWRSQYEERQDVGWKVYQRLRNYQEAWHQDKQGVDFANAVTKLSNLCEAAGISAYFHDASDQWPIWRRIRDSTFLGPCNWHPWLNQGSTTLRSTTCKPAMCLLQGLVARRLNAGTKGLRLVTKLHLQFNLQSPMQSTDAAFHRLGAAFGDLDDLSIYLNLNAYWAVTESLQKQSATEWTKLLLQASNIRKLTISTNHHEQALTASTYAADIMPLFHQNDTFERVQHISLSVNVPAQNLLPFLARHKTLQKLELTKMLVGDVPYLLQHTHKYLKVRQIHYRELIHDVEEHPYNVSNVHIAPYNNIRFLCDGIDYPDKYEMEMREYLHGRIDRMPDLEQDPHYPSVPQCRLDAILPRYEKWY